MVETRPSHSSDDLARRLDAIADDPADSMFGVNQLSAMRLLEDHGSPFHIVSARFTGDLPGDHEIGVRAATMVLGELQEIISEVGAVLLNESPRRGPLPASILEATELRFAPQVLPGSVIFTLHPAHEAVLFKSGPSTLDDALTSIFGLFDKVERPKSSGTTSPLDVADALREFGPRTARHLVKFASALDQNGLNVDVGVVAAGHPARASHISRAGARFLGALAEEATSRTTDVDLVGLVRNLGTDNKHRFDDETRGRITMTADADVTAVLLKSFADARVRVRASETESVKSATGATTYRYHATAAEILEA
jgi:hypothetical protein